ncbi:MAG: hypothetical protein ACYC1C_01730 [Chloroflexota bacterium]
MVYTEVKTLSAKRKEDLEMDRNEGTAAYSPEAALRRRAIRFFAVAMSGAAALIYFLIGLQVLPVLETTQDQTVFGIIAGLGYALGVVLLLAFDRRVLWVLGAALQLLALYTYFNVASQRTPPYEFWGLLLKVMQLVILVALVYLAIRPPLGRPRR